MITDRALGLRQAEAAARAMNKRHGVRSARDIRIEAFVAARGIEIVEGGVVGAIARLCWGTRPIIRVSERVKDVAERRWSMGHELGHFVLDHPIDEVTSMCKHEQLYRPARPGNQRHFEAEANVFAAEVLMPRSQLAARCEVARPDLDIAHAISREFSTPIAASAIRFVEITPERCCAIYSEDGSIVWSVASDTFTPKIRRGSRLDPATIAYDFTRRSKIDERPQPIPVDAWVSCATNLDLIEHSVVLPGATGVLTLLWIPEATASALLAGT
ncbi:MAG: ImmA/IrrE family metallo-endopeptidase [Kofleriaceae bacterium]